MRGEPRGVVGRGAGKEHRPRRGRVGHAPPQLAVDEVAEPPRGEPGRHHRRNEVGDLQPRAFALIREQHHRERHAEKAAVKRHAAFPHLEDVERMREVKARLVEQHVAEPAAENRAEHAVKQHVVDVFRRPALRGDVRQAQPQPADDDRRDERDEVHQSIPAHGKRPQVNGDGVEVRVNEHRVVMGSSGSEAGW